MAGNLTLDLQQRTVIGKKVKQLRRQGILPLTVYGKGFTPVSAQVDERTFNLLYRQAGRTRLIEINIPGQPKQAVFVQDVQRHPLSRAIIHVDLRVVDLQQTIDVEVPVLIVGESPLVKRGDALLNQTLTTIAVRALPASLPQHIDIDISALDSFDKVIHVRDLPTSSAYSYVTAGDEMIVSLTPAREETAAEAEEERPAEPEVIRKGKKEEEEE